MTDTIRNSILNDAAGWDARLRAPDCNNVERATFKRWCEASPENQQQFDELQMLLGGLRSAREAPEIRSLREASLNAAAPAAERRGGARAWGLGAAAVLSVLAIGLFYVSMGDIGRSGAESDVRPSFATAVGERSTTSLEDGTVTVLNTNTRLQVAYSDQERRVMLLQGQALFDVAKEPDRPFVVVAGEHRITAIGTVFDVRFEGKDVQVTMIEGVVEVIVEAPLGANPTGLSVQPTPVRLTAGQQLSTSAIASSRVLNVEDIDVERATIWRQGRVFFEDAPLSEAVAEMNRYSTTQIVVRDTALDAHRVNGMFYTGRQANFVDALAAYFPLYVERVAANRILLKAERGQ